MKKRETSNMKKFNIVKPFLSIILVAALVVTLFPIDSSAAKVIKLNKTKITLNVGAAKKLKLKNNKKKVKWSSNKKKVATVTQKGKVMAKKKGTAIITAKVGRKKYKCKVTVKEKIVNRPTSPSVPEPTIVPENTATDTQNIIDLTKVDSKNFDKETGRVKDSFANVYSNCYVADTLNDTYVVLYLAQKYNTLNLTIAPTEERHSGTITYTQIYADDILIYTSEDITKTTKPINLNFSVKNVDVLKIVEVRTTLGDYDRPTLYAGDVSK